MVGLHEHCQFILRNRDYLVGEGMFAFSYVHANNGGGGGGGVAVALLILV